MDEIILTFTPEQYNKYKQIKEKAKMEKLVIEYGVYLPVLSDFEDCFSKNILREILKEADRLLDFSKEGKSFFLTALSKDEIRKLIPVYFSVIKRISELRSSLYSNGKVTVKNMSEIRQCYSKTSADYRKFLPYKAALCDDPQYRNEILTADENFLKALKELEKKEKIEADRLSRLETVCNVIISNFFKASEKAADSPRFEHFNDAEFFSSVKSFIEQIKNI